MGGAGGSAGPNCGYNVNPAKVWYSKYNEIQEKGKTMTTYTNLHAIHDECDDYISAKEGHYIITKVRGDVVYVMNIDNGAQGLIAKEYFDKEFEPCK